MKGATKGLRFVKCQVLVSIHAPMKGATHSFGNAIQLYSVSIHAPMKGATRACRHHHAWIWVSIHAPMKGATRPGSLHSGTTDVSIHAPMKGATMIPHCLNAADNVSIHAPMKGATLATSAAVAVVSGFNPRTSCEVRHSASLTDIPTVVSIHAPLARCDAAEAARRIHGKVSIHAPLARCDPIHRGQAPYYPRFQSTHLLRGATLSLRRFCMDFLFQSTHLLRGATNFMSGTSFLRCVSIHAPLARCDVRPITLPGTYFRFNPRTSCEVRQSSMSAASVLSVFQSTHLLRGATDPSRRFDGEIRCFNPRTSCEVRPVHLRKLPGRIAFQSTHLLRGATDFCRHGLGEYDVSIHAPLARCDAHEISPSKSPPGFNPRTSCEVRPGCIGLCPVFRFVSIHAPLARCDIRSYIIARGLSVFQSTHLLRGATP